MAFDTKKRVTVNNGNLNDSTDILTSVARTATPTIADFTADSGVRGVVVTVDVTTVPGSAPSTVVTIKGKDPTSGKYYTMLASAAITATGTTVLKVFPGATAAANAAANDWLPQTWTITAVHGNANSMTYSIGASYLG